MGLEPTLDRGTPTGFHFVRRRGDDVTVGEIETRSRAALRDALEAFKELSDDGVYVREIKKKKWRKAGSESVGVDRESSPRSPSV